MGVLAGDTVDRQREAREGVEAFGFSGIGQTAMELVYFFLLALGKARQMGEARMSSICSEVESHVVGSFSREGAFFVAGSLVDEVFYDR